jgi:hypothetical protein
MHEALKLSQNQLLQRRHGQDARHRIGSRTESHADVAQARANHDDMWRDLIARSPGRPIQPRGQRIVDVRAFAAAMAALVDGLRPTPRWVWPNNPQETRSHRSDRRTARGMALHWFGRAGTVLVISPKLPGAHGE